MVYFDHEFNFYTFFSQQVVFIFICFYANSNERRKNYKAPKLELLCKSLSKLKYYVHKFRIQN